MFNWTFHVIFYANESPSSPSVPSVFLSPRPGKPAEDEVKLGSLKLKPNTKIMMMGTREESLVGDRVNEKCIDSKDFWLGL